MSGSRLSLREILFQKHLLDERALVAALRQQLVLGGRLGTNLVELGFVRLDDLGEMLSIQLGVPHAGTRELRGASLAALTRLDPGFCFREQVLPLAVEGGLLHLAMCDPRPERVVELSERLKQKIVPHVTPELRMYFYLEEYYRLERPKRYLRVPDGGEAFSRRRHYLFPTVDPLMADVLTGSPYDDSQGRSPFGDEDILIFSSAPEVVETPAPGEIELITLDERDGDSPRPPASRAPGGPARDRGDARRSVIEQLLTARTSADVAHLLVRPIHDEVALSVLYWVRGAFAIAWLIEGGLERDTDPVVSLETPSVLQLAFRRKEVFRTAGEDDTLQLLVADHLGVPPPGQVCVVPVTLFGRVVYLLCLQTRPGTQIADEAVVELQLLSDAATAALERMCAAL